MPPARGIVDMLGAGLDRVIGAVSPVRQVHRVRARLALAQAQRIQASAASAYEGARTVREKNWRISAGSADADLDPETLATLRERSRERVRNDAIAAAAVGSMVDNVVGVGLRPQLRLPWRQLGITEQKARDLADIAAGLWAEWGERADSTGRLTIEDVQNLVFSQVCVNGDVFVQPLMIDRSAQRRRFELALEIIEGDRVESPNSIESVTMRHGVELDGMLGEPVAYHVLEQHPGDTSARAAKYRRIPAFTPSGRPRMLHLAGCERPGQTRGRPLLSPALKLFKSRDDFFEATLVAAQIGACFAAFVTKSDPLSAALARASSDTRANTDREEELSPGFISYLAPGEDVKFGTPTQPGGVFESFIMTVTREMTASMGMPYEVATRDFSHTTYSQARASLLEARRMFMRRQRWLVQHLLRPVYRLLLEEAWLKGLFPAGSDFLDRVDMWTTAHWITPGWGLLDPLKEAQADQLRLEMGVTTRAKLIAGTDGDNWEETFTQLALEKERMDELGITPAPTAPAQSGPQQRPDDAAVPSEDESGDESDDEAEVIDE